MKRKGIIGVLSVATLALAGLALLPSTPTFAATTSSSNVTVRLTVLPSGESVVIRFPSDGDTFATDKRKITRQLEPLKPRLSILMKMVLLQLIMFQLRT